MDIAIFTLNGLYIGSTYGNSQFINKFATHWIETNEEKYNDIEYWNNGSYNIDYDNYTITFSGDNGSIEIEFIYESF